MRPYLWNNQKIDFLHMCSLTRQKYTPKIVLIQWTWLKVKKVMNVVYGTIVG